MNEGSIGAVEESKVTQKRVEAKVTLARVKGNLERTHQSNFRLSNENI